MPVSSRLWFIAAALIALIGIVWGPVPASRADSSYGVSAFVGGLDDPDDPRLKFRVIRTCDPHTSFGSLCHHIVRFKNGNAMEFSDPVCLPIACPAPDLGNGEE